MLQGRFDEAEQLLAGPGTSPRRQAAVSLRLARGGPPAAGRLLRPRLGELGPENLLAAPLLAQLVEARLAAGDVAGADRRGRALDCPRRRDRARPLAALGALARGRIALAAGDPRAPELLQRAVNRSPRCPRRSAPRAPGSSSPGPRRLLAAGRSRPARRARMELEALGAVREADAAAALMRALGAGGEPARGRRSC